MSIERAKAHLEKKGYLDRVIEPEEPTFTVEQAAAAVGCEPAHIAKSMSFLGAQEDDPAVILIAAGDAKISNKKFRGEFGWKPHMVPFDRVEEVIGHAPGGVCALGVNEGVKVYCDVSLKRFAYVYPAAGNDHSAVKLTCDELFDACDAVRWVDACQNWE